MNLITVLLLVLVVACFSGGFYGGGIGTPYGYGGFGLGGVLLVIVILLLLGVI